MGPSVMCGRSASQMLLKGRMVLQQMVLKGRMVLQQMALNGRMVLQQMVLEGWMALVPRTRRVLRVLRLYRVLQRYHWHAQSS